MKIRVKKVPPGNEPIRVWRTMIGLEFPVLDTLHGVQIVKPRSDRRDQLVIAVPTEAAIPLLARRDQAVADWCRKRLRTIPLFIFDIESVELL